MEVTVLHVERVRNAIRALSGCFQSTPTPKKVFDQLLPWEAELKRLDSEYWYAYEATYKVLYNVGPLEANTLRGAIGVCIGSIFYSYDEAFPPFDELSLRKTILKCAIMHPIEVYTSMMSDLDLISEFLADVMSEYLTGTQPLPGTLLMLSTLIKGVTMELLRPRAPHTTYELN